MAAFLNRLRSSGAEPTAKKKDDKKDEPPADLTPLERLLYRAGPVRPDGTDKFYGLENFGNTCYCNSILQPLFYCDPFRDAVLGYASPASAAATLPPKVKIRVMPNQNRGPAQAQNQKISNSEAMRRRQAMANGQPGIPGMTLRPEDRPEAPEYKKKQAMIKGPILELAYEEALKADSGDTTLAALQDIFRTLVESESRTGVLSPQRFLEIFKSNNESFRNAQHQDAHEFLGLVLNSLIGTVDSHAKQLRVQEALASHQNGHVESDPTLDLGRLMDGTHLQTPSSGWVHDIFEGLLTSETRCLTCETASKRDETFLDLSIDLEEYTSVTSCLKNFSAEEMLCERNKFHCDTCGSLQEAEKRMKVKRLPKVLALHLKRFKFTEDYTALNKLFHRVVYPSQLRLFNTTDDAGDPDRVYELYAVVIHIGPQAAQGHYVVVIKTKEWGWLLFDDEMVEPVGEDFVNNFFGGKPGQPCAYVLFYQEVSSETFTAAQESAEQEGVAVPVEVEVPATNGHVVTPNGSTNGVNGINGKHAAATAAVATAKPKINGHKDGSCEQQNGTAHYDDAPTTPLAKDAPAADQQATPGTPSTPLASAFQSLAWKAWKERKAELAAAAAAEKVARKVAEKEKKDKANRDGSPGNKSMGRRSFGFLSKNGNGGKGADSQGSAENSQPGDPPLPLSDQRAEAPEREKERLMGRIGFGLGRKKSTNMLSSA